MEHRQAITIEQGFRWKPLASPAKALRTPPAMARIIETRRGPMPLGVAPLRTVVIRVSRPAMNTEYANLPVEEL